MRTMKAAVFIGPGKIVLRRSLYASASPMGIGSNASILHCCGVACRLLLNFRVFGCTSLFDDIEIGAREGGKG